MNIYADRGNIIFLQKRCQWRGIGFELTACGIGEEFDPALHDMVYIGGGQDRDQQAVARDLVETKRDSARRGHEDGMVMLAVCGGYQLLGHYYELGSEQIEGLGLVDLHTVRGDGPRLIGPVAIETTVDGTARTLAGFENHGGRTWLGTETEPLGKVVAGHGNNGEDGFEGIISANTIGTYLHGPLLPKNAWLADYLIRTGLERTCGGPVDLPPLDDELETAAHRSALEVALSGR
jgi:CobQ-like glutamine amidotransferase family enzyme